MRRAALVLVLALAAGCETPVEKGAPDAADPSASSRPAPIATPALAPVDAGPAGPEGMLFDPSGKLVSPTIDGGEAPESMQGDRQPPPDTPQPRELSGVVFNANWHWREVPQPPRAPEVNLEAIKEAAKLTSLGWRVELADYGRMRVIFTSRALPLPTFSEIRGRSDRFGHVVVWPSSTEYRVVPPGALRTLVGERRVDVTPLSLGTVKAEGDGKKLGVATHKVELTSALGTLKLELGKVPEAADGGQLFCRLLVEIAGIDPRTPVCQAGEVPLAAVYAWQGGGGVSVDVSNLTRRSDFQPTDMLVPPPTAQFAPSGLPASEGVFLTQPEIAAFRSAALTLPPVKDTGAPGEGLIAVNETDALVYLLLDGVPVVSIQPNHQQYVIGPRRGRFSTQWRTFLGERILAPKVVEMPARLVLPRAATPDAGAPPPR